MGDCGCLLGKGLCSHTPSLSYTGFSTMSSQQEPLKLWGLPLGVPVQTPCVCLHASVGLCDGSSQFLDEPGAVLGRRCPSAPSTQPYLCIPGAHTGTETTTSTSHGTERKGSQHCFQPHGGLDPYRDPQLPAGPFLCILWSHSPAEQRPASTSIYQPWCSSYSYFICTKRATQQCLGSLSSSLDTSSQKSEQPDNLLKSSLLAPHMTPGP